MCEPGKHQFQGRYDTHMPPPTGMPRDGTEMTPDLAESLKETTYVRDVCVKCGETKERAFDRYGDPFGRDRF